MALPAVTITCCRPRVKLDYPDAVVVCGGVQLEDVHPDTVVDPTLIVEVLSPSTASVDRNDVALAALCG